MSKITRATLKSFVRKNAGKMFIKVESRFDGTQDGVRNTENQEFSECVPAKICYDNNLGIQGVWLVPSSNNSYTAFDDGKFAGIYVYNCCGSFTIAVKK